MRGSLSLVLHFYIIVYMYTYHCKFDMYYNSDEIKDSYSYYHYNYYYYLYNYYYYSIFGLYLHNWEIVVIQK